jgi:DNA (cytosine-5)-methyltransferase 1
MNNLVVTDSKAIDKTTKSSVELFGGAGGLALGISQLGFSTKSFVELDHPSCLTLRMNQRLGTPLISEWPIVEDDVRNVNYSKWRRGIDLLSGGPPCQPFSLGGKHGAFNDNRDMFPEAVRAVREIRPKAFIFENVKGLTRQSFASYFSYIQLQLTYPDIIRKPNEDWAEHLMRLEKAHTSGTDMGYRVVVRLLNAADYGVPQKRERVIFVGFREDLGLEWAFPKPTHSFAKLMYDKWVTGEYWDRHEVPMRDRSQKPPLSKGMLRAFSEGLDPGVQAWQTVRDAIYDLPEPTLEAHRSIHNHQIRPGARTYLGHTGSYIDEPSKTIKAGAHGVPGGENMLLQSDGSVRYFTVREAARIQNFPDSYVFPVSWSESMRQLGNAVPVNLALAVIKSVDDLLRSVK